jgi:hypothetical protein
MHNGLLRHTHSPTIDPLLQMGLILDFGCGAPLLLPEQLLFHGFFCKPPTTDICNKNFKNKKKKITF